MSGKRGNTAGKTGGKKGQSANEAMVLITLLTFFLIVTLAAVSDDLIRASDNNYKVLLQDLADFLEQEAQIAFGSEEGYSHSFTLPRTLNGQPYAISILNHTQIGDQANITILSVASTRPNIPLNLTRLLSKEVRGNLVIGPNIVVKERGVVIFKPVKLPPPVVSSVNPTSGPTAGGTVVSITGSDFIDTPAVPAVSFGGAASPSVTFVASNLLTAVTPPHAFGAVDVVVSNPDGQSGTLSNGFTYVAPPPTVSGVSPQSGSTAGGTSVAIIGTGFINGATVSFGGVASPTVTFVSSTQLTAVTPAHAVGVVDVVVTNPDGQSGTLSNGFTYVVPPPSITSVNPTSGSNAGGTSVTITGTGFINTPTVPAVSFGSVAASSVTFVSSTQLTAITPAHAVGAVDVVVTNPDGQSDTLYDGFAYVWPPPSITSVNPTSGSTAGGTWVTVTGSDFRSGVCASFGGVASPSCSFVSSTQFLAATPAHAAGTVDVRAVNNDGQFDTLVNGYTYVELPPTVTIFTPRIGLPSGGTSVSVYGSGFVNGATVRFGGAASPSVTYVSSTQLTAVTPANAVGYASVVVTNPSGQSGTASSQFLYRITPVPIGTVFITSSLYNGNIGGLAGADNNCQARANAGGFGGTWRAWLSTSTVNANTRIPDTTYRKLDNVVVANSLADLTDGTIANRINVSNDGSMYSLQYVWTGTTAAGIYPGGDTNLNSCSDWASSSSSYSGQGGISSSTNSWWTYNAQRTCNNLQRLYCFKVS